MSNPRVTIDDIQEALIEYTSRNYIDDVHNSYDTCPYEIANDDEDVRYMHAVIWFMCKRKNSEGLTVIDEFVNKFVIDEGSKRMLLRMKGIMYDLFHIFTNPDSMNRVVVASESDGKKFTVEIKEYEDEVYEVGNRFIGMIHPWYDDGVYRTIGALMVHYKMSEADFTLHTKYPSNEPHGSSSLRYRRP